MRGISLLPIIYVWIARDSRAGSLRNTGSVLQPSLCSLPEPYRVMFWGFPKIRGVNRLNEVKPPWGDAECSRPCPSEGCWAHWEQAHLGRHTFWPAKQETNAPVQPSEVGKREISSIRHLKCPKCEPQRQENLLESTKYSVLSSLEGSISNFTTNSSYRVHSPTGLEKIKHNG